MDYSDFLSGVKMMNKYPPFSVAMSVYNNDVSEYFAKAMDSIINQTIRPNEIVLVVDGPIDAELKSTIINYSCRYEIIKIIWLTENKGLGNALCIAVDNCSNELIARMDSDDISINTRFEQQLELFVTDENLSVAGGDITEFIGVEDNVVGKRLVPKKNSEICKYIKHRCPFNHVSVMFKKSDVIAAGNYKDWFWNEDYYLWIRMFENKYIFKNTGTVLVNVRVGPEMYQRRGGGRYFKSELDLQKYMLKRHIIKSPVFLINVLIRIVVQVVLPNKLRGFVFKKVIRKRA